MIINERFRVDPSRNELVDLSKGQSISIEPRLMKLLCLLVENRKQTVTREVMIKVVWDDYPGAGESLNQAISGLRKLLGDDQKKIIETIPKSGYCFNGTLEESRTKRPVRVAKAAYILPGVFIVIALVFLVRYYQVTKATVVKQSEIDEARISYKMDSARQEQRLNAANAR